MLICISIFECICIMCLEEKKNVIIKVICGFVVVVKKNKLVLLYVLFRSCYNVILFLNLFNKIKIYKYVSIVNF